RAGDACAPARKPRLLSRAGAGRCREDARGSRGGAARGRALGAGAGRLGVRRGASRARPGDAEGRRSLERARVRLVPLLGAVVLAAGCGSSSSGRAIVWVTRDRGAHVLHVANVPAGLTAAQGLERVAKVETRYGGRYIRSVDGVEERGQRAWFYYVNGYLADRSAAEYRLHAGDVEWWDYRSWKDPAEDPLVV